MREDALRFAGIDDRENYDFCLKNAPKYVFENFPRTEEIDWSLGAEYVSNYDECWTLITYVDANTHRLVLKYAPIGDSED